MSHVKVKTNPHPCSACPWRLENQGQRHPGAWYSRVNLRRLWAGLRRGARMSCHPTDWRMNGLAGAELIPEGRDICECTGSLIVVQREFMKMQKILNDPSWGSFAWHKYRSAHPRGLTRAGALAVIERAMFAPVGLDMGDDVRPDLNEPGIGYPDLGEWHQP